MGRVEIEDILLSRRSRIAFTLPSSFGMDAAAAVIAGGLACCPSFFELMGLQEAGNKKAAMMPPTAIAVPIWVNHRFLLSNWSGTPRPC